MDNKEFLFGVVIGICLYLLIIFLLWFYGKYIFRFGSGRLRSLAMVKFAIDPDRPNGDTLVVDSGWSADGNYNVIFKVIDAQNKEHLANRTYEIREGTCPSGFTIVDGQAISKGAKCIDI